MTKYKLLQGKEYELVDIEAPCNKKEWCDAVGEPLTKEANSTIGSINREHRAVWDALSANCLSLSPFFSYASILTLETDKIEYDSQEDKINALRYRG